MNNGTQGQLHTPTKVCCLATGLLQAGSRYLPAYLPDYGTQSFRSVELQAAGSGASCAHDCAATQVDCMPCGSGGRDSLNPTGAAAVPHCSISLPLTHVYIVARRKHAPPNWGWGGHPARCNNDSAAAAGDRATERLLSDRGSAWLKTFMTRLLTWQLELVPNCTAHKAVALPSETRDWSLRLCSMSDTLLLPPVNKIYVQRYQATAVGTAMAGEQ